MRTTPIPTPALKGKKALVVRVANAHSIACACLATRCARRITGTTTYAGGGVQVVA